MFFRDSFKKSRNRVLTLAPQQKKKSLAKFDKNKKDRV